MTDSFAYDVFLSYARPDRVKARRLAEALRDAGLAVWFDEWCIAPGDNFYLALEHGLETSRALVLCMSPAAFRSEWVDLERSNTIFGGPPKKWPTLVAVLSAPWPPM